MGANNQCLTLAAFVAKSQAIHGAGKYDYSQVIYNGRLKPIKIICLQHGEFVQVAGNHLDGRGCSKCRHELLLSKARKRTALARESFVSSARAIHGDKYDYSQAVYEGSKARLTIICPLHGPFAQAPQNHLKGCGCTRCAASLNQQRQTSTTAKFIKQARAVHSDKYDYSQVIYVNNTTAVTLVCPVHGQFEQKPMHHLRGGCIKCGYDRLRELKARTTTEFIEQARAVHGDKYDYSQVVYVNSNNKVLIICSAHGPFEQHAGNHLIGINCRKCTDRAAQQSWVVRAEGKKCILYFLRIFNESECFYKVGITYSSIQRRYAHGSRLLCNGYNYEVLAVHQSTNSLAVYEWEQSILESFAHIKYRPQIRFDGETECFSSADEILSIFPL